MFCRRDSSFLQSVLICDVFSGIHSVTSLNCFFTLRRKHVVRACWKGFNKQIAFEEPSISFVKITLPLILLGPLSSKQEDSENFERLEQDPEAWPWLAQNLCCASSERLVLKSASAKNAA